MEVEEFTIRLAEILSQAMNALALIASAEHGQAVDGPMLHQMLTELISELEWLEAHRDDHPLAGLRWPADAPNLILRTKHELHAWDPATPPTDGILVAAAECLRFARGSQPAP
jgi:hypothetical protein